MRADTTASTCPAADSGHPAVNFVLKNRINSGEDPHVNVVSLHPIGTSRPLGASALRRIVLHPVTISAGKPVF
jgi:hypothetical protein